MGVLRFPGLATGIDTAAIVNQLMIINSRRLAKYQLQKVDYEKQTTALDELRAKVSSLESTASALSDIDDLEVFSASSSDTDVLTLIASSDASQGSHSILIDQMATTNTWIQDTSTFDYKTDYVGGGSFIYSYNNKETTITAIADETTLEDFVNLINNDENNPGVTASLLYQGGTYHLMLSGRETGEDYQISINATSTEVWRADSEYTLASDSTLNAGLSTKITELSQFAINAGLQGDEVIEITGTDRYTNAITQFDLSITSNTTLAHLMDAIEDAFDGNVKATLEEGKIVVTDKASGLSELTVSLAYNAGSGDTTLTVPTMAVYKEGAATSESLASFASTSFVQTQTAQNSEIKVDGYPTAAAVSEVQAIVPDGRRTSGTFKLTYNGQTTADIAYNAPVTGAGSVQEALEALSNVDTNDIVVSGDIFDTNPVVNGMIFTFSNTLGDVPMLVIDARSMGGPGSDVVTVTETTKGVNPWISANSNTLTDVLAGITLNLHDINDVDSGDNPIPVEITVNRDTGAIRSKITRMVNAYNALITTLKKQTEYDTKDKKMGILSKDVAVSLIKSQSRDPFIGTVDGFISSIDTYIQSLDIGLTIDGAGMMEFDTDEFNEAIDEDYTNVLELLGATKNGNSSSTIVQFYGASDRYTTAGTYEVEVDISSNAIDAVRIRLSGESTWRTGATWTGTGLITLDSTFDSDTGDPLYAENSLQLAMDLTNADGTYTATVRVKQGMAGTLEDLLDEILEADGRLDVSTDILDHKITAMDRRIEYEEARLTKVETRLILKFARLEKTLALMQLQMSAVSMVNAATFG
ncbi:MAG: hypothetical protein FVQ85_05285 [Planctomycetes bacterium]|nr:hypothetical protein [Planctomycetota bacterium]